MTDEEALSFSLSATLLVVSVGIIARLCLDCYNIRVALQEAAEPSPPPGTAHPDQSWGPVVENPDGSVAVCCAV